MSRLAEFVHHDVPVWATRRGRGAHSVLADGTYLAGLGSWASLVPVLAALAGFVLGWQHLGYTSVVTENPYLLLAMLAIGVLSSQAGVAFVAGFAVGDFVLGSTTWYLAPPGGFVPDGLTDVGIVAGLVFERVPLLIHYVLIAALVVGIPVAVRAMVASLAPKLRGSEAMKLFLTGVLLAIAGWVFVTFWTAAAPFVVRPVFTWVPEWQSTSPPPLAAIAPTQNNATFARAGAVVFALRAVLVWAVSRGRDDVLGALERRIGDTVLAGGPLPQRTPQQLLISAAIGATAGVAFIAGLLSELWVAMVMLGVFFVIRLARTGVVPFPPQRWRATVDRVPLVVRFFLVLLVMHGVSATVVGGDLSRPNFHFMMLPIAIGLALMALLLPGPTRSPRDPDRPARPPDGDPPGPVAAVLLVAAGAAGLVLLSPSPALADNCSGVSDCFFTAFGVDLAILATFLSIGLDFVPVVGDIKGVVESVYGRDLITGQKLEWYERALGLVGLSELRHLAKAGDAADALSGFGRARRGAQRSWDSQTDAYRQSGRAAADRWQRTTRRGSPGAPNAPRGGNNMDHGRHVGADEHIYSGHYRKNSDINLSGGHSRNGIEDAGGTVTPRGRPDSHGVYEGTHTRTRNGQASNPKDSSMFPDNWDQSRINREVDEAFGNQVSRNGSKWEGISSSGARIEGRVDGSGAISTAYPKRQTDFAAPPPGATARTAGNVARIADDGGIPSHAEGEE